jgi:hypothetical protein
MHDVILTQLDLFGRMETPAPATPITTPRRCCPITVRGAVTGSTGDLETLVVGLDGKEVMI